MESVNLSHCGCGARPFLKSWRLPTWKILEVDLVAVHCVRWAGPFMVKHDFFDGEWPIFEVCDDMIDMIDMGLKILGNIPESSG